MDHFIDSVLFAAGMTMLDALKQPQEQTMPTDREQQDTEEIIPKVDQLDHDPANTYARLCDLLDSLFQSADEVSGSASDITAKEFIPAMLFHVFYIAIKDVNASENIKIKAFDTALHYCNVPYDFSPSQLFSSNDSQLAQIFDKLSDVGFSLVIQAANTANRENDGIGFMNAFAELVNLAEEVVYLKLDGFTFSKKAALIALEKPIKYLEETKRQMEEENPELKNLRYGATKVPGNSNPKSIHLGSSVLFGILRIRGHIPCRCSALSHTYTYPAYHPGGGKSHSPIQSAIVYTRRLDAIHRLNDNSDHHPGDTLFFRHYEVLQIKSTRAPRTRR